MDYSDAKAQTLVGEGAPTRANTDAAKQDCEENRALEAFYEMKSREPSKAFSGKCGILRAAEIHAVEFLWISEKLILDPDVNERNSMAKLIDDVRKSGGEVKIVPAMHGSAQKLEQLSGVCAILKFPMMEFSLLELREYSERVIEFTFKVLREDKGLKEHMVSRIRKRFFEEEFPLFNQNRCHN